MSTFGVFLVLLIATFVKHGNCDVYTEASELALVASGKLLASAGLTEKLGKELKTIRAAYPAVSNIVYSPPWSVGVLIAEVSDDQLDQIRIEYGEVTSSPLFADYKILTFTEPYNSKVLANELLSKNLVESAELDNIYGGGDSIGYNIKNGVYTFSKGWGDCPSGCIYNHSWQFIVCQGYTILIKEYGTPLGETGAVEAAEAEEAV